MPTLTNTLTIVEDGAQVMTSAESHTVAGDTTVREYVLAATGGTTYTIPTDIGNARRVSIKNTDANNFVDVSLDGSANDHVRVYPNTISSFGLADPTLASFDLTADTANCTCIVHIAEA